ARLVLIRGLSVATASGRNFFRFATTSGAPSTSRKGTDSSARCDLIAIATSRPREGVCERLITTAAGGLALARPISGLLQRRRTARYPNRARSLAQAAPAASSAWTNHTTGFFGDPVISLNPGTGSLAVLWRRGSARLCAFVPAPHHARNLGRPRGST